MNNQTMTINEIREYVSSNEYGAELALQHVMRNIDDLERRLAIARAFIRQVKETSSSSRLQREAKDALTQTGPKS